MFAGASLVLLQVPHLLEGQIEESIEKVGAGFGLISLGLTGIGMGHKNEKSAQQVSDALSSAAKRIADEVRRSGRTLLVLATLGAALTLQGCANRTLGGFLQGIAELPKKTGQGIVADFDLEGRWRRFWDGCEACPESPDCPGLEEIPGSLDGPPEEVPSEP
jgi:hypothetical protein